jgi:hypothetical protein
MPQATEIRSPVSPARVLPPPPTAALSAQEPHRIVRPHYGQHPDRPRLALD